MEHETADAPEFDLVAFVSDPAFWALIGLLLFLGLLLWRKIPATLTKSLDDRAAKIAAELANAEALRAEAEAKLADAERRQAEAEADAKAIVEAARREAAQLAATASVTLADKLTRREKQAEDRIARAEADALRDVKLAAIDTASTAAALILTEQFSGKSGAGHFAASLESVKKALA